MTEQHDLNSCDDNDPHVNAGSLGCHLCTDRIVEAYVEVRGDLMQHKAGRLTDAELITRLRSHFREIK